MIHAKVVLFIHLALFERFSDGLGKLGNVFEVTGVEYPELNAAEVTVHSISNPYHDDLALKNYLNMFNIMLLN